jgi:sugar lactone lactonase YvrE
MVSRAVRPTALSAAAVPTRKVLPPGLSISLLAISHVLAGSARADVIYQTGFEPPAFTAGQPLSGRDGWLIRIGPSPNITVQSNTVYTGAQAVQFDAAGAIAFTRMTRLQSFDSTATTDKVVAVSVDAMVSAPAAGASGSQWDLIVVFDGSATRVEIGTLGVRPTGELYLSGNPAILNSGVFLPRGSWNHLELDINLANRTLTGFLNGIAIYRPLSYPAARAASLGSAGFQLTNGPIGTDSAYFDNFSIVSKPAPAEPDPGPTPLITTIAGSVGPSTGLATGLGLRYPILPTVDAAGNILFADADDNRVWKVTPDGMMSVVAGNGMAGFSGDGGPATSASLKTPQAVAVDSAGNLYITDANNNRIRMVTPAGVISTFAGTGIAGFGGDGGPAPQAQMNSPGGIVIDSAGNLFFSDDINYRIRMVTPAGIISTVAGNGSATYGGDGGSAASAGLGPLNSPGMALDKAGNLYIPDAVSRVRKVTPPGIISTVAGNGTAGFKGDGSAATAASLDLPSGVAVDSAGNLYISDSNNNRIRKVTAAGIISTIAGNGTAGYNGEGAAVNTQMNFPVGVALDTAGNLYIADPENRRLRKLTPAGIISTLAGDGTAGFGGDGASATSAVLAFPLGVALDSSGNVFIADYDNNRVRKVTPFGLITTVAGTGSPGFSGDEGPAIAAKLFKPYGLAVDSGGNLFIADSYNQRVRKVSPAGVISTFAGNGRNAFAGDGGPATQAQFYPFGIGLNSAGNLYIADWSNNRIRRVTPAGVITTVAGSATKGFFGDGGPATAARLSGPYDVTVDGSGNLYIADTGNNRIRKVTSAGVISTVAGNNTNGWSGDGGPAIAASLSSPESVAVDGQGNLYIADSGNNRIRKVTPVGTISTIAGTGVSGFSGDGGPAASAQLSAPVGIKVDSGGNIYFADFLNHRIREIVAQPTVVTLVTNPPGLSLTVDGVPVTAPLTLGWLPGSTHTIEGAPQGSTDTRYVFASWSDGGSQSHTVTAPPFGGTYTATFTAQYLLTLNADAATGAISASPVSADGFYDAGTAVKLTATATDGFQFLSFSGDLTGRDNPQSLVMSAPRTVTASFGAPASAVGLVNNGSSKEIRNE